MNGVAEVLQWYCNGVSVELQCCYSGVSVVFQWPLKCFSSAAMVLQWCYSSVSMVFGSIINLQHQKTLQYMERRQDGSILENNRVESINAYLKNPVPMTLVF